jgi:UDP-N-acetylmuramate dehydrogenase
MLPSISKGVPLAPLTTLQIGGPAEYFAEVHTLAELQELTHWAHQEGLPVFVLGGGSNVLIHDTGVPGLTLAMKIQGITYESGKDGSVLAKVASGESWDEFVSDTTKKGLWGLENLSGIPGKVGGAPIQNINAYGVSVGDMIVSVEALHHGTNESRTFSASDCQFGYRESFFKTEVGKEYIITGVTFQLSKTQKIHTSYRSSLQSVERYLAEHAITAPTSENVRDAIISVRKRIGMVEGMYRSAGSFFKNVIVRADEFVQIKNIVNEQHAAKEEKFSPWNWELPDSMVKISTAFLMECTPYNKDDFKEKTFHGCVGISPVHTLSLVNINNAHADDVRAFAEVIIDAIEKEFGVRIETEVCFIF